jgi:hypothetical protein
MKSSLKAGIFVEQENLTVNRPKVEDRSLIRTRQSMVKKQTRCKKQIKSILHFYGIQVPEELANGNWSKILGELLSIFLIDAS